MPVATDNTPLLCNVDDSSLLMVDIQTRLTAAMPSKVLARLQRNAGLLLKAATLLDVPIFTTEQYPQGLGNTEAEILKLLPDHARMYEKTCFAGTGAEGLLMDLGACGRKHIVLGGMEAHVCVLQTAFELVSSDYDIFVVADAICSRQRESYETAIQRMRQAGIIICDAESILFEWLKDARHEHFKAIQSLLR